jgi:multisubunit Na+/H+ antiporter MnhE subunit
MPEPIVTITKTVTWKVVGIFSAVSFVLGVIFGAIIF